jgi:formylmethanofuran dehydrogenase subunit E-like metal-binding protein
VKKKTPNENKKKQTNKGDKVKYTTKCLKRDYDHQKDQQRKIKDIKTNCWVIDNVFKIRSSLLYFLSTVL